MVVPSTLSVLIDAGLLDPAGDPSHESFTFRHALIHDAAYGSLLRAERRTLHRMVGVSLENEFRADETLELAPRLAEHFQEGGDSDRAHPYFALAAEGASRTYANSEAIHYYRRALATADQADPGRLRDLTLGLGRALELSGEHGQALAAYEQLERSALQTRSPLVQLEALMARAKVHATLTAHHDPSKAETLLEQARGLAQTHGDPGAEARILWNLMVLRTWGGEHFQQAVAFGKESADIARKAGATETLAFALNDLVYPLVASLEYPAARSACDEARGLWRRLENLPMLVDSLSSGVLLDYAFGSFDDGEAHAGEARRISEQIDNVWGQTNSRLYVGQIERDRGRIAAALETFKTAVDLGDRSRHPGALIASRVDLALLLADLGDPDQGRDLINQAEALSAQLQTWLRAYPPAARALLEARQAQWDSAEAAAAAAHRRLRPQGLQWFAPVYLALAEAEIGLARNHPSEAEAKLTGLVRRLEATPELPFLPEALRLRARALANLRRLPAAEAAAEAACDAARRIDSRWTLWPALLGLAEVRRLSGDDPGAAVARREAASLLNHLVPQVPEGELRTSFLARPDVRAALGG